MSRAHATIAILSLLVLGLAGTALVLATLPPPVRSGPVVLTSPAALSSAELGFYQTVAPVLRDAAGEARALTTLGEERSRNLFAIGAGQSRLEGHLQTLDGLLGGADSPERFAGVAAAYDSAAATVRAAMAAAEAAFLRFDWDAVGIATEQMAAGANQLAAAAADLDHAVAPAAATPAPAR